MKRLGHRFERRGRSERAGSALVIALMAFTSLTLLIMSFYTTAFRTDREIATSIDQQQALVLADAALAESIAAIRAGGTGSIGNMGTPARLGDGLLWVQASPPVDDLIELQITAACGSGRAAVQAVVETNVGQGPLFYSMLNSRDALTINARVTVDSFNSSLGSYASQAVNTYGGITYANPNSLVSSNTDVAINANAHVFGDAIPGPGHIVTQGAGSYVSGSTTPALMSFSFPPMAAPSVPLGPPMSIAPNSTATIPSGTYGYSSFTIGRDANLTIEGPASIVVNDFLGDRNARLHIDATNGPVTFYVKNTYTHIRNFEALPATGSPMALAFLIEGSSAITFPSSSRIRGAYYAPNAEVSFTHNNEVWGAVGCKSMSMNADTRFHYDEALAESWTYDSSDGIEGDTANVIVWRRIDVPQVLLRDRRDPFAVLNVNAANLPSPANAWDI